MKKIYTLLLIVASISISTLVYKDLNSKGQTDKGIINLAEPESIVELKIDSGDNKAKSFNVSTDLNATAFSVLKATAEKENINLQVKQYDFGVFVEKIGDFESTAKKSWIYYVNGESGQIAADQQKLKNGDKIEWKYEIPK